MVRIRAIVSVLAITALGAGLVALSLAAQVWWSLPTPQGRTVRGPHDLVGIHGGRSYAWVVPTEDEGGVVLVDSGGDKSANRILAELRKGAREVRAILLTHAHGEQIAGLEAFPDVPVYLGVDDEALLTGDRAPGGWLARLYTAQVARPAELHLVRDGEQIAIDGATFIAVATPGHTPGHVTWWWKDVLFTGGALLAATPPTTSPSGLNDDDERAIESIHALLPLDFDVLADARTGLVTTARPQVHWMLGAPIEAPTRTLLGPRRAGPRVVQREGTYVETWLPGVDGLRPGLVVDAAGHVTVTQRAARAVDRPFVGRRVVVEGTVAIEGRVASDQLANATMVLADGEAEGNGRLPLIATLADLPERLHQWVVAEGQLSRVEPWVRGASHGEGRLVLASGETVRVTAPATWRGTVTLLGTVSPSLPHPILVAHKRCSTASACRSTPSGARSE